MRHSISGGGDKERKRGEVGGKQEKKQKQRKADATTTEAEIYRSQLGRKDELLKKWSQENRGKRKRFGKIKKKFKRRR